MKNQSAFDVLRRRDIYDILCGKIMLDEVGFYQRVHMPTLSERDIRDISKEFGLKMKEYSYTEEWQYMAELFIFCIKHKRCSDLLKRLFSLENFLRLFSGNDMSVIKKDHELYVKTILSAINEIICGNGYELLYVEDKFVVEKIGKYVEIHAPSIQDISNINRMSGRAMNDIKRGDYDSAITKSRSMLEDVLIEMIKRKGKKPSHNGNIREMFKTVAGMYGLRGNARNEKAFNTLISGLNSIVDGIAGARDEYGDAHGGDENRIIPDERQALLVLNAAETMAEYLLSI